MEKIIKYLLEMSKIRDEVALDLKRVAARLDSLKVAMGENINEDKAADSTDQF